MDIPNDRGTETLFFDAWLHPHRSLGRKGFIVMMVVVSTFSASMSLWFFQHGAWPVPGFCGLDVLGLYWAFRTSYRRARLAEAIQLDQDNLTVRRFLPGGKVQMWRFEPYWVRVQMDDPPQPESQFALSSHGRRLVLGSYLTPDERLEVAQGLRDALRRREGAVNPGLLPGAPAPAY